MEIDIMPGSKKTWKKAFQKRFEDHRIIQVLKKNLLYSRIKYEQIYKKHN